MPVRYRGVASLPGDERTPALSHLADLVATHLGQVVARRDPDRRWILDDRGALAVSGSVPFRLLAAVDQKLGRFIGQAPPRINPLPGLLDRALR